MKRFTDYCNKKIDEADLGFVEPGLDKGDQGIPYNYRINKRYRVVREDKDYKLTKQDKNDLKSLVNTWKNLKDNIDNELLNFDEKYIYRNNLAEFRMQKARKLLKVVEQMEDLYMGKYI